MSAAAHVLVFAKAPVPGQVKSRLQPPLTAAQAADLHGAFVRDVVARERRADRPLTVCQAGDADHPFWGCLAEPGVGFAPQVGADLGQRMAHALEAGLATAEAVVLIGTDTPSLPAHVVDAAFAALAEVPVVLGPACDGGYYLIGARGAVPPVFDGVPWGTDAVLGATLQRLDDAGLPWRLVDFWYDVDRPADLTLLRRHLGQRAGGLPATRAALRALEESGDA